jgi:hypothetical protein
VASILTHSLKLIPHDHPKSISEIEQSLGLRWGLLFGWPIAVIRLTHEDQMIRDSQTHQKHSVK